MTSIGSTGGGSATTQPSYTPSHDARPASAHEDAQAMKGAFARAQAPRGATGKTALPVRGKARDADPRLLRQAGQPQPGDAVEEHAAPSAHRGQGRQRFADDGDQGGHRQDGQQGLMATAQAVVPLAAPDMPGPHVDPSAFAQLLSQLWLKERGKGTKEVRVTFGQDAWPATGARLVRNAAGTLDIQLHVGDGGAAYGDSLAGLGQHLSDQGLAVGALALDTDAP